VSTAGEDHLLFSAAPAGSGAAPARERPGRAPTSEPTHRNGAHRTSTVAGAAAAGIWVLLCVRWFDAGESWRAPWLTAIPPAALAALFATGLGVWLAARGGALLRPGEVKALLLVGLAALAFRLPLVSHAAAGYTTADASMAGLMALRVRDGIAHDVFIPNLAYCGSLKSHLAAPLMTVLDPVRSLALVSVLFYAAFAAGAYRLAALAGGPRAAAAAALMAVFSPTFVTQYSLSNDGNYVELLAFGTWATLLAVQWLRQPGDRKALALGTGALLGLGFWCHVLGVIHVAAVTAILTLGAGIRAAGALPRLVAGFGLGNFPALLWNASHDWNTFRYLMPSEFRGAGQTELAAGGPVGAQGMSLAARLGALVTDHGPILFGYDPGYPALLDVLGRALAGLGLATVLAAGALAVRESWRERALQPAGAVALLGLVNILVVTVALPHIPGNPRYLLFSFAASAVLTPWLLTRSGWGRAALFALIGFGALGSLGQGVEKARQDADWRGFVSELRALGISRCHSDYYTAARVTFDSGGGIVCSSQLGPTWTDYFELHRIVARASNPALIAPNAARADKLERKLERLGVAARRVDLMRPVLLPETRVDPRELFPQQPPL